MTSPSLVSPRYDWLYFAGPGIVTAILAVLIGATSPTPRPAGLGLWISGVLLVDVTHVWASLYRTYLDPQARRLHRARLRLLPVLCLWVGFLLHLASPLWFWRVLAYVAIFHFIKQHVGFVHLYARKGGETRPDVRLASAAVWAGTLGPVVWWHAHLPRQFAWFVAGDLVPGLPAQLGTAALAVQAAVLLIFLIRRVQLQRRGRANPLLVAMVLLPAINWTLGIVIYDDDRIFTLTNVFLHGVPYLALVWVTGGRERVSAGLSRAPSLARWVPAAAVYYGLLVALAFTEEGLWDRLVWHDHPGLFGTAQPLRDPTLLALVAAILTVPQATHYLLDRWIWRAGPQNPKLAHQLGFPSAKARPPPGGG